MFKNRKQAYLIIAHKDDTCFRTLLRMIDDPRNDIYIHMDSKNKSYDYKEIEKTIKHSNIIHTQRTKVSWGAYSLINAELILLKASTAQNKYQHYHLLSGADLPIKSQNEIYHFFLENDGKEFVNFQSDKFVFSDRIKYYYPFMDILGRTFVSKLLNISMLLFQKAIGIHRNDSVRFQKGANWFSISDELARYVISSEDWIRKTFKMTYCADEMFLQTLIINSDFYKKLYYEKYDNNYYSIVRLIDWNRGQPYVFRKKDFNEICNSKMMFARKFDAIVDAEIIKEIEQRFSK